MLADHETDRVERTVSTTNTDKFCIAVCGFANDMANSRQPGYLFIGANPDGTASGAQITERLLENLAGIRAEGNVLPSPVMTVEKWSLGEGEMAVIEVLPSDLPPVRYKGQIWIRVGPRRGVANESEERALTERRTSLSRTWDVRPCLESTLSDLVLDLFLVSYRPLAVASEIIAENHRSVEEQLAALRFYDPRAGFLTNSALLLFGKDPTSYFPGAFVQYVRYKGTGQADTVEQERRFSGDLISVMRGLDQLCQDIAGARPIATGLSERTVFDYPPAAIHELLMNGVIHRNYENSTTPVMVNHFADRLEILNPGGLYGDLTLSQFPRGTSYRNPVLAESAKILGFVNRYGRGIAIAQDRLQRNDSPPAEFTPETNHMLVIVRRRP